MVSCARATRGLRRMGRVAWPSSCSRNAHDKNVLVRRAQSRIGQATLENEMGNWEKHAVGDQLAHLLYGNTGKLGGSIGRQSAPRSVAHT